MADASLAAHDPFAGRVGVDIGGTFTDIAVLDPNADLRTGKVLTTPTDESEGVLAALSVADVDLASTDLLVHGTTLVINALLERRGARAALVTTAGFRDVLELARENRPQSFNLFFRRDPVLIERSRRFELDERMLADGSVERTPSAQDLEDLAAALRDADVDSVAIAFINSYANPANEELVAEHVRSQLPHCLVTSSADLSKQWREYERSASAAANAYVAPQMDAYLARLEQAFADGGLRGTFVVLDSNGGALLPSTVRRYPVRVVESGPVGGVVGAMELATELGIDNVVTFDMGGTTAKTALVEAGRFASTDLYWVGGYETGFPLQVPSVDIVEVGAGGGSIAWRDATGRLRVGPRSAGASPGPACYAKGGVEPTVTDANVYLERLPTEFALGDIDLRADLAEAAIETLAQEVDLDAERLAEGILRLADLSMADAVRRQTVARGRDPREFTLIATGGAGPLHAAAVAREVGIRQVLVPASPGHFSAIGMLQANLRFDRRETFAAGLGDLDTSTLEETLTRVSRELREVLSEDHRLTDLPLRFGYSLALRYEGQEHTLLIPARPDDLAVPEGINAQLARAFVAEYDERFGHTNPKSAIEVVEVAVFAERLLPRPQLHGAATAASPSGARKAAELGGEAAPEGRVALRARLRTGDQLDGPAILCEPGSTTYVPAGATAQVLDGGHLMMRGLGV